MIEFQFIVDKVLDVNKHLDIVVFFVLQGDINFRIHEDSYNLRQNDFIVVNSNIDHAYVSTGDVLIGKLQINRNELIKLLKQNNAIFLCNSTFGNSDKYRELKELLKKICTYHYSNKDKSQIYLMSIYYNFLNSLCKHFLLTEEDEHYSDIVHKNEERKQKIINYINENYDKQVSLNDLADKLFLSNAYLSKYIKKQFGMSFLDCINKIRIERALEDLIYSDKPVVRIAMDAGFSSSAAFNKIFKEKYNTTPSNYRGQWKGDNRKLLHVKKEQKNIDKQLLEYYKHQMINEDNQEEVIQYSVSIKDMSEFEKLNHKCQLINIGAAADLLHSDMQNHILKMKTELGISYVRFWDIYSAEMFLDKHAIDKKYNFSKLDRILDFLVSNGLIPYMEIGVKPKKLIRKYKVLLLQKESEDIFSTPEILRHYIHMFIKHLINRYGMDEVNKWYFEYWRVEKQGTVNSLTESEELEKYLNHFDSVAEVMRKYLPSVKIGGSGLALRFGEENFMETLSEWKKHKQKPEFITLYCYPYASHHIKDDRKPELSLDRDYVKNYLTKAVEIIKNSGLDVKEIHVSEWNFTVSNRNSLNDSYIKGAYLVKNILDVLSLNEINLVGYWIGSDLFADFYDSDDFLNGSGGLITKDGIEKPSYYAFKFINQMKGNIIKKGDNYIITNTGNGNYKIVCHNFKQFNYQYCLSEEDEIVPEKQDELFEDNKKLSLKFHIDVPQNGRYEIKTHSVSKLYGSIQDEWIRMGKPDEISQADIEYLSRISIPRIKIKYIEVSKNNLAFDIKLDSNEIKYIKISYLY